MKEYQMTTSKNATTGYNKKENLANVVIKIYYNILLINQSYENLYIYIFIPLYYIFSQIILLMQTLWI